MNGKVYVWDWVVRCFHWLLVAAFLTSYLSGDEWESLHVYSGYLIMGLLLARILWGVIGSKHARFSDFVRSPAAAITYLKGLMAGNVTHYRGHNPAGGLMVIALLLSIAMTGFTGLKTYGFEGKGPLAVDSRGQEVYQPATVVDDGYDHDKDHDKQGGKEHPDEEFWEELHEFFVNFTLLLVLAHVAGVYFSSRAHGENLVKAMITGYKDE
ncbi:cytochrome b/b6 domain-containing protein [Shewanella litorisediminis]|uniref:Cytochrome b/b6 domain-containing protein n=1 Tax=Shewanella litorisediminis TaxID=1173586 RepID=A0ABX7G0F4_9GAMM|nr:cytochrome b/b6 domain-containing protein [Shewanella litorisediminis]MCL2918165.1 cytochrome b/b6 domain-containing protein [Shewanella litorisediminis]QRH00779.1 cytochrome b/b6 domain-containing protein [Shewanella litorisediminis]